MDLPAAPINHHWQDATHTAFGVLTAGVFGYRWKLEASIFNGREPDENRWDVDAIRLDSYSARLTVNPTDNWSLSGGFGYLDEPEQLHPGESMRRITASAMHGVRLGAEGQWSSTLVYGANRHANGSMTQGVLVESEAAFDSGLSVIARAEYAQKPAEDLGLELHAVSFGVSSATLGVLGEVAKWESGTLGLGVAGTINLVPEVLGEQYGSRASMGALFAISNLRLRPAAGSLPRTCSPHGHP